MVQVSNAGYSEFLSFLVAKVTVCLYENMVIVWGPFLYPIISGSWKYPMARARAP